MAGTFEVSVLEIPLGSGITFSYKGNGTQLHAGLTALAALIGDSVCKLGTHQHTIGKLPEDAVREITSLLRGAESNITDLLAYLALPREKREEN